MHTNMNVYKTVSQSPPPAKWPAQRQCHLCQQHRGLQFWSSSTQGSGGEEMERAVNLFSCWIMKMQITSGPVQCHRSFILHCIFQSILFTYKQVNLFWSSYMIICWNEHECNYYVTISCSSTLLSIFFFWLTSFYPVHSHTNFAALLLVKVLTVGLLITAWPHELLKVFNSSFKLAASFLGIK